MGRGAAWAFGLALFGALLWTSPLAAQAGASPRMPAWDVSGALTLDSRLDSRAEFADWDGQWLAGVQFGRYLTQHLKVEVGGHGPWHGYRSEPDPLGVPGLSPYSVIWTDVRTHSFTPALTWQFRENSFVHPFISVGVRLDLSALHRYRYEQTVNVRQANGTTVRYVVPAVDSRRQVIETRPFVAVGTKSYLNSHWFVRPEVVAGFGGAGVDQLALRLGIGVDF